MDLYCKYCKKPTSSECLSTDHVGHQVETIVEWNRKLINDRDMYLNELRSRFHTKANPEDEENTGGKISQYNFAGYEIG